MKLQAMDVQPLARMKTQRFGNAQLQEAPVPDCVETESSTQARHVMTEITVQGTGALTLARTRTTLSTTVRLLAQPVSFTVVTEL